MAKRKKLIKRKHTQRRWSQRIVNTGTNREGMEALGYGEHARGLAFDERAHNLMVHAIRRKHPEDLPFDGKTQSDPKLEVDKKLRALLKEPEEDRIRREGMLLVVTDIFGIRIERWCSGSDYVFTRFDKKTNIKLISKVYRGRANADYAISSGHSPTWKRRL